MAVRLDQIRLVGIQNYGSSGSMFLHSLFDGHPHVLGMPGLRMADFYTRWAQLASENAELIQRGIDRSVLQKLAHAYLNWNRHWFHPQGAEQMWGLHQLGPEMNEAVHVDQATFLRELNRILGISRPFLRRMGVRRVILVSLYLAYARALGREIASPLVIVYPVHSQPLEALRGMVDDFPDLLCIYTVRDPVQNVGSLIRHVINEGYDVNPSLRSYPVACALSQVLCDYMQHFGPVHARYVHGDVPLFEEIADRCRAVRLEDLHRRPREVLQSLCEWIGIPWDEALLKSTFDGKQWWNRPTSVRVAGFSEKPIAQKHQRYLGAFDRIRIRILASRRLAHWGYRPSWAVRSPLTWALIAPLLLIPLKAELVLARRRVQVEGALRLSRIQDRLAHLFAVLGYPLMERIDLVERLSRWGFRLALPFISLSRILRDYLMVRWWLYRAWWARAAKRRPLVDLLPIKDPPESPPD